MNNVVRTDSIRYQFRLKKMANIFTTGPNQHWDTYINKSTIRLEPDQCCRNQLFLYFSLLVGFSIHFQLEIECTWMRETQIDWIFQGPACAVLLINLIFLFRIMWVSHNMNFYFNIFDVFVKPFSVIFYWNSNIYMKKKSNENREKT